MIVTYKCDTCKREIELKENSKTIPPYRCIITLGCRGFLIPIQRRYGELTEVIPERVEGLKDWQQRKVLYNHIQTIKNDQWRITHNLGTVPVISVYKDLNIDNRFAVEIQPDEVIVIDEDNIILKFNEKVSGIAQLIAKETDPDLYNPKRTVTEEQVDTIQTTSNGILTIATKTLYSSAEVTFKGSFEERTLILPVVSTGIYQTPWSGINEILFKQQPWFVQEIPIGIDDAILTSIIEQGSTVKKITLDGTKPDSFEVFILLGKSPYQGLSDRELDKIIDFKKYQESSPVLQQTELFANTSLITTIYPYIIEAP